MKKIEFDATFGDKTKHIEISWPTGAGDTIHISIDNYYNGQMAYQNGEWRAYLVTGTILTGDDVSVLIEIIERDKSTASHIFVNCY
jgi:hypothetical protein